jgi:hypothetical protein
MMRPLCELAATVAIGFGTGALVTATIHGIGPTAQLLHGLVMYLQGAAGELARGTL